MKSSRNIIRTGSSGRDGKGVGLDFNPTCFSHPKAADGFTLSHPDKEIRQFWIEHCRRCRDIGAAIGKALGKTCVTNVWIPDGYKDTPADRRGPRERLVESRGRRVQETHFTKAQPRRRRTEALRHRQRKLRGRVA